ncbi:hypothetical protein [Moorena bouillonii]|nr:hypothetical protein [Moorena bouillonii]
MRSLNLLVSIQLSAVSSQWSAVSRWLLAPQVALIAVRLQCDRLT